MIKKRLKILFDANPIVNGQKSGVGYYTQNLIQAMADTYPDEISLVGHYFSFMGKKDNASLPQAPNISYVRSRIIPGKILSVTRRLGFQPPLEIFFKQKGDAAIFTNFFSLPSLSRVPRMIVVHDLCYLEVPQYVADKNRKFIKRFAARGIRSAAKVITISEATKQAIKKHYAVPDSKFVITPIPPTKKITGSGYNLTDIGVRGKYILFVGNLEPRKNVIALVKAYEQLPKEIKDTHQLVLAGGTGWHIEETLGYIKKLQDQGERIVQPGYITDECKTALYEHASLLVLPSHYEGFGMPILEAMNYGIPTAISDIAVFHEVAGDASLYFDKDSPSSIARTISQLLKNPGMQKSLVDKGYIRLQNYDWQRVARTMYEAIGQMKGDV